MHYTNITFDEMKTVLDGWNETDQSTHEYVYEVILHKNPKIIIKVYTSISKHNDSSRKKGQDAIRICAVNCTDRIGWIKTIKVLRVAGWRRNLIKAIIFVTKQAMRRLALQKEVGHILNPMWTKYRDFEYETEVSSLKHAAIVYGITKDTCPHCGNKYSKTHLIETKTDLSNKIRSWIFRHNCTSTLTVNNE